MAISPVLLTQLGRMVDGYEVSDDGETRRVQPGEGGAALAKQALEDLRAIVATPNVEVTALLGSRDPSLYGGGLGRDVDVQLQHGRDVTSTLVGAQMPETILRPPGAALDDATLRGLAADGIRTLIVGPTTVDLPSSRSASPARPRLSLGDGSLAAIVPEPASDACSGRWSARTRSGPRRSCSASSRRSGRSSPARRAASRWSSARTRRCPVRSSRRSRGASRQRPGSHPPSRRVRGDVPADRLAVLASPSFRRFPTTYVASLKQARRRIDTLRSMLPDGSLEPARLETMLLLAEARQYLTSTTEGSRSSTRSAERAGDGGRPRARDGRLGDAHVGLRRDPGHGLERGTALARVLRSSSRPGSGRNRRPRRLAPGESETLRLQASLRSTGGSRSTC